MLIVVHRTFGYRDALITSAVNGATSFISGFVIFSVLGYMSCRSGVPLNEMQSEGWIVLAFAQSNANAHRHRSRVYCLPWSTGNAARRTNLHYHLLHDAHYTWTWQLGKNIVQSKQTHNNCAHSSVALKRLSLHSAMSFLFCAASARFLSQFSLPSTFSSVSACARRYDI